MLALRTPDGFKIASLGNVHSREKNLIDAFFKCLEKYLPSLVSWNGSGFDLPVLHYRALLHGISSPSYWNTGEQGDTRFRWNNYLNRYHTRHTDLMDILVRLSRTCQCTAYRNCSHARLSRKTWDGWRSSLGNFSRRSSRQNSSLL
ncbi:3'-5' exonuclease [Rickettsiella massiliensis]|uniref:3'-5' exonuclease n=1 Tax=Rickettsiella massiliensis TaxID=676517 RepID=UPI002286F1E8|nr:ribonuclease H-like domain-containing protein [Rickettsiella massiliensis]